MVKVGIGIIKLLQEPFPSSDSDIKGRLRIIFGSGFFVSFFLIVFQPFGAHEWQNPNKNFLLAGFGMVTAICLSISLLLFPRLFTQYFREAYWTLGKEILNSVTTILLISLGNYTYSISTFDSDVQFSSSHLLFMVWATFLVGLFPSVFLTYFKYQQNHKKYSNPPVPVHYQSIEDLKKEPNHKISLRGDGQKEELDFMISDFLMAEASGNYVEIFLVTGQLVNKKLIRATMSRLERELPSPIIRCHRSFLANLNRVEKVSGNAQGYRLHFDFGDLSAPVGRNFSDRVIPLL